LFGDFLDDPNGGHDWLDGGLGDDRLDGGSGLDTYFYRTGQGQDRIIDADKIGTIQFDGQTLVGGLRRMGKTFCFQACMLGAGHSAMNSFLRKAA
jgi:Ca2+-binding RTX toxin-like protein